MKDFLKNPMTLWLQWYLRSRLILIKNKNKHLKIGYLTELFNVKLGNYNTFYENIIISNSKIDDFVYIANGTKISNTTIGKFCSIGQNVQINAGIFPSSIETSVKFSKRFLEDIPLIDLLGTFQYYEKYMPLKNEIQKCQLETLYPFFVENPWTKALEGKKALIVHPFEDTIKSQYKKRKEIFSDPNILPDFELITFKAVQSVAGNSVSYSSWFEALSYMEDEISKIEFDIAIIGCGAYGLPLSAFIKRMGKKGIHLAGGTQLLFGIKGKRWVEQYENEWAYRPGINININYRPLFNSSWVYPLDCDTPKNSEKVENSCYW